jgi:hypothetical protein
MFSEGKRFPKWMALFSTFLDSVLYFPFFHTVACSDDHEIGKHITPVSRQWLGKHVPRATNRRAPIEVLLEMEFSTLSVQKTYKKDSWSGSNTSTVALRVVGGDKKGSLESETVKYGRVSHWNRTKE